MILLIMQPPECVLDQSGQPICSAIDGLIQGLGVVSDHYRLAALEAGFHQAAFVVLLALVAVLIAQVDLHSCDVIAESTQGALHHAIEPSGHRLVTLDVMVGIDLNLHVLS
jgi:hypothetical protein